MAQLETRSEQLTVEDNKARYDQRNTNRKQLIADLSDLQSAKNTGKVVDKLNELGFGMEEGFADKSLEEMKAALGEAVNKLQGYSNGIITVTSAVKEGVTETTKDVDALATTLEKITEGRYLSIEAMNEALKSLQGVNVEIPETEMARLNGLRPAEISEADMVKMETMKDQSEDEKGLMVMQLPEKIMVDGKEKPFTIATMQAVMKKAVNADDSLKPLYVSDYVPGKDPKKLKAGEEDIYNKVWPSDLQAWTSACLKDSKNKNYKDQLAHQAEILGEGNGIEADMFLAMTLRYISSKEELMRQDFMRLNTRDAAGDPLYVSVDDDGLGLGGSRRDAFSFSGVGGSLRISS